MFPRVHLNNQNETLAKHLLETFYRFDYVVIQVLASANAYHEGAVLELPYIEKVPSSINNHTYNHKFTTT